jgi:hypothetical protein
MSRMWEVWAQVMVAKETRTLRGNFDEPSGAFQTVAELRRGNYSNPWAIDTVEKYYKRCQRIWKEATN